MEMFHASNETSWEKIQRVILESDFYIVILGGRYGSLADDGISYTEKEYRYAVENGIPVASFLHEDVGSIQSNKVDSNPKIIIKRDSFFNYVKTRQCSFWKDTSSLCDEIMNSLLEATGAHNRPGWIRNSSEAPLASSRVENTRLENAIPKLSERASSINIKDIQKRLLEAQKIRIHFIAYIINDDIKHRTLLNETIKKTIFADISLKFVFSTIAMHMLVLNDEGDIFISSRDEIYSMLLSALTFHGVQRIFVRPSYFSDVFLALNDLKLIESNTKGCTLKWKLSRDGMALFAHERAQRSRVN